MRPAGNDPLLDGANLVIKKHPRRPTFVSRRQRRGIGWLSRARQQVTGSIDLKDWPSHLPLPSEQPSKKSECLPAEREQEPARGAEWTTPWKAGVEESSASTDVGFATSIASTYSAFSWDYEDRTLTLTSDADATGSRAAAKKFYGHQMICENRHTTWRREESSPLFFFLALIIVCLCAAFLSPSLSTTPDLARHGFAHPVDLYLHQHRGQPREPIALDPHRNKSTLLFPSYQLPVAFEIQSPAKGPSTWSTYGVIRRISDPLRLTVSFLGAAITVYAWRWF